MLQQQRDIYIDLHQLLDALVIAFVFWVAHVLREQLAIQFPENFVMVVPFSQYKWLYLIILPLYPFLLNANGFYSRPFHVPLPQTLWILSKSASICALIVIVAMYFLSLTMLSRGFIVLFAFFSVAALAAKDMLLRAYLRSRVGTTISTRPVLLVGSPERNAEFEKLLTERPEWGMTVVGKLDATRESLRKLPALLHRQPIGCVIFNVGRTYFDDVQTAILACETEGVETWLVADFVRTAIARVAIADFHGKPILVFRTAPDVSWQLVTKRVMDIIGAVLGLLVIGPLVMLPTMLAIRLTSPGPVLFRQKRSGLHGRLFTMYKFRSMTNNAEMLRAELEAFNEMTGPVFKIANDPRVTRVGRFIRTTSIDELPQLWNILKGDMSLVGPRPPIPSEVEKYDTWHRRRLSMRPGLTCLWQVSGRNRIGFDQWMKLDLQYIDTWSVWLDLKILARTVPVVFSGFGAH
ncbi:MAG: sugar transferase [Verrucomicrobia bacterium]|nr:sugar transferase [Verrucomicrobiota bacterium]